MLPDPLIALCSVAGRESRWVRLEEEKESRRRGLVRSFLSKEPHVHAVYSYSCAKSRLDVGSV